MVVGLVAALVGPVGASSHDETGYATTAAEYDLLAGQDELAGKVYVWDAFDNVYVQYVAKHGWCILETHVEVTAGAADIPQNRGGPIPGKFSQGETFDDCVAVAGHYAFEDAIPAGGNVVVAAHAVVQKTIVIEAAPYFANEVLASDQGVQVDGQPIATNRSNPVAALEQEYPNSPRAPLDLGFFSLGFKHSPETGFAEAGGSIEVSFECPVIAGEGPDLRIWEVTFGAYPEEKAEVFAWDGTDWVSMGFADNSTPGPEGTPLALTVSDFDLPDGLMSTEKIKVVDKTDPALFRSPNLVRNNADGFDLDGIQALQDCTEVQTETAWADGDRFVTRGNWATFASYTQGDGTLVDNSARELTFLVFDLGDSSEDLGGMAWVDGVQQYVAHTVCAEVAGDSAWFTYQIPEGAAFGAGLWVTFKVTAAGVVGYSVGGEAAMVNLCQTQANITGGWAGTASGTVIVHP